MIESYELSYKSDPFFSSGVEYVTEGEGYDGCEEEEEDVPEREEASLAPIPEYEVWPGQAEQREYLRRGR